MFIMPFPPTPELAGKRQVSTGGAAGDPRWRKDGREIFYKGLDGQLFSSEVTFSGSTLEVGATRSLFNASVSGADAFDVTADGQRFLMLTSREQESAAPLTLIQNWTAALAR